jgi:hypothetical protein
MSGVMKTIGRTFTPEGEIMGIDWASMNKGEQKARSSTESAENAATQAPIIAAKKAAKSAADEATRIANETAGKPAQRAIGRARGGSNTIFTSSLGMGGLANLARKTLLGQ